jgi:hypothetical protein
LIVHEREEKVFGRDVFVAHFVGGGEGAVEGFGETTGEGGAVAGGLAGDGGSLAEFDAEIFDEGFRPRAELGEEGGNDAFAIGEEGDEEVLCVHGLVFELGGEFLGLLECRLGFESELIESHLSVLYSSDVMGIP